MPSINEYKCNKCKFKLPEGWGHDFYVENDKGKRIRCGHPAETSHVAEVLGKRAKSLAIVRDRTGFNSHCVCLDCLHQFQADVGELGWNPFELYHPEFNLRSKPKKDERECPECKSKNVKTELEMVGEPCPKCKEGIIEEIWTGAVS